MSKEKITKFLIGTTLVIWFFYAFATPFLVLVFNSYASFLYLIEYILITGYIGIAVIMVFVLRAAIGAYRFYIHLKQRWQHKPDTFALRDVSDETRELSTHNALNYKRLIEELGFQRLGETENTDLINYIFVADDNPVVAVIRQQKEATDIFFETVFVDGLFVITGHNTVFNLDVPGLQRRTVDLSVDKAYNYHLHQVEKHRLRHGQPVQINTIEQTVHFEQEYRQRYLDLEIQVASKICIISLLFSVLMEITLVIGVYGLLNRDVMLTSIPMGVLLTFMYLFLQFIPEMRPVELDKRKRKV